MQIKKNPLKFGLCLMWDRKMHPVFATLYNKQMRHFIPTNCQLVTKNGYKITVYSLYIRYVALQL